MTTAEAGDRKDLDWQTRLAISIGGWLLRLLARTWRITAVGRASTDSMRASGRSSIFTFWHGQMLPLVAEHHAPTTVLISDHRDGEIITRIVRTFGCRAVRGSTSRGAARALLQLSSTLDSGRDIAITPDGPRGPRHSFAPGALILAQRTGAPIVLLASHCRRVWRLGTWDGFEIPKPFARVTVIYDEPLFVATANSRDAVQLTDQVASRLQSLVNGQPVVPVTMETTMETA